MASPKFFFRVNSLREMRTLTSVSDPARIPFSGVAWGYICGVLGAIFFAMKAVFIKLAYQAGDGLTENGLDPITLITLRMGFALPVYVIILIWVLRMRATVESQSFKWRFWIQATALGTLCYYLCAFLDFTGLRYITAQLERMLLFTYPIFVMILGAMFFGRKISFWGIAAIVFAYAGIGVIFIGGDIASGKNVVLGSALVLGAAFLFAIFQLLAVNVIKQIGSEVFTCVAMISASFIVGVHFLSVNGGDVSPLLGLPRRIYVLGVLLAVVSTLIPSFLVNIALGRIGAQPVAILGMFGPIATILAAIILLGEPFGFIDGLGTLLVIFGIGLYTIFDKREKSSKSEIA